MSASNRTPVRRPTVAGPPLAAVLPLLLIGAFCSMRAQVPEFDDDLLLDATWVPCSDSTESLHLFRDGRAIYAHAASGIAFTLGETTLAGVAAVAEAVGSVVDTTRLDSCTTVGVILAGPRYLLINGTDPSEETGALHGQLELVRSYAQRRLERDLDRSIERVRRRPNRDVKVNPTLHPDTLQQHLYQSPIAATWRCRGSVTVTAQVDAHGTVRRAFVYGADVKGKCSSLLVMTALRAVLLSRFEPAVRTEGKVGSAWMNVAVAFGTRSVRSQEAPVGGEESAGSPTAE